MRERERERGEKERQKERKQERKKEREVRKSKEDCQTMNQIKLNHISLTFRSSIIKKRGKKGEIFLLI